MKYLKTVILKNFQSHKHSIIELDKGLNVIVGPSDTGKSSIIRGIKWALYNEPSGDYFIRKGETDVSVILIFSDGSKLERYRSKSKNQYILYNKLGEEIKYEGFGLNVPEEIIEAIGIKKIYLDSDETNSINLGEQLEGAFLLSEKTSTRASAIGRLIGVNIIDDALKDTLKDLRNESIQIREKQDQAASLKEELNKFKYLKALKIKLEELEKIKDTIRKKYELKEKLSKIQEKHLTQKREIKNLKVYLNKLKNVGRLENKIKKIDILNSNYKYYNNINKNYKYCIKEIDKNESIIYNLKGTGRLQELQNTLYETISFRSKLYKLNLEYKKIVSHKTNTNKNLLKLKNIETVKEKLDISNERIVQLNYLNNLRENYNLNQKSINKGKAYISKFENLLKAQEIYDFLYKDINRLTVLLEKKENRDEYKKNLEFEEKNYKSISIEIDKKINSYKELLKKQEVCPLCLSKIDNDKISHIIKHYK